MQSMPDEWISLLRELQVRFAALDPTTVTVDDLAGIGEQLAVVEKHLRTSDPSASCRPPVAPATPSTLRSLLTLARADLAAALGHDLGPADQLSRIVELAVRLVPGTQHASVTVLDGRDRLDTLAATSEMARVADQAQRDGDGPAFACGTEQLLLRVDDLRDDRRWPGFAARAGDAGVRSLLVCELPAVRRGTATLNLYSRRRGAFRAVAELVAPVFAARAAVALAHASQVANLRTAIDSRQTIGTAVGILMERHRITEDEAFQRLVSASQSQHIKLREIAMRITETGEDPETIER
jgi:ANTAR domain